MNTELYRKETARGIEAALDSVKSDSIEQVVKAVQNSKRVFFTGAGRSFLMTQAIAMAFMQIGIESYVTGGVTTPAIQEGDLLVAASCSGETKSVILFMEQARKAGAGIILITACSDSTMGRMSDIVVEMEAKSEPGSEQEKWLTDNRFEHAIVPLGDCFMECLARKKGAAGNIIKEHHANME